MIDRIDKPVIRMSSAGTCPRALSAELLGYSSEPAPDWLDRAANEGKWHEERIVQELEAKQLKNGRYVIPIIYARQAEVKLEHDTFVLLGHIDGKYCEREQGSGDYTASALLEIKSMSQYEFDRWMRDKFSGFPEYADQITCYMEATGLRECLYLVKNRSSGYTDRQTLIKQPAILSEITDRIASIVQSVQNGELYPVECDFSTIRCKRCFYKQFCIPTKEEMTVQDEKVLLKAAEDWRKGDKLLNEGKVLIADSKKIFEEHTIAAGLKKWSFANLAINNITVKEHEVPARIQKEYNYIRIDDTEKGE